MPRRRSVLNLEGGNILRSNVPLFYVIMAVGSGVSIVKIAILAHILSAEQFTLYASVFALVGFVAEITSFGLTQSTVKRFPRLAAHGRFGEVAEDLRKIVLQLVLRHGVTVVLGAAFVGWIYGLAGAVTAVAVAVFAFGTNVFVLTASLFRALDKLTRLGLAGLIRATAALLVCVTVAALAGWRMALLSEAITTVLLGLMITYYFYRQVRRSGTPAPDTGKAAVSGKHDGLLLFFSHMVLILPITFDRSFITQFDKIEVAKTYAFLGIWLTAAATLTGIFVQKFGPDTVRALTLDLTLQPLSRTRKQAALLGGVLFGGTLCSFAVLYVLFFDAYWVKYGLTVPIVIMAALAVAAQVSLLFDWTLIALDGEKTLMAAAALNLACFCIGFALCLWTAGGYEGYAAAIVAARACQMLWADRAIARAQGQRRLKNTEPVA